MTSLVNDNELAWEHWASLPEEDEVLSCFVVVAEWEYGIRNAQGRKKQQAIREQGALVLSEFSSIIESSPEIAIAYGEISAELREAGNMIPQNVFGSLRSPAFSALLSLPPTNISSVLKT